MIINLMPHALVICNGAELVVQSSGVARCTSITTPAGSHPAGNVDVALTHVGYGPVEGLPEPALGVLYVVSALVRMAVPHRHDVASPGELVRDGNGAVIGCQNLIVNG